MSKINELSDEMLENVVGGEITYTWDGSQGTIGINGYNPFILLDKDAFISYYNSVKGSGITEAEVLTYLFNNKIIIKR